MLMTAAVRMDSTTSPTPPPWFPVPPAGNHRLPYDDFTAPAPSPTPATATAAAAAAALPNQQHHRRPAARRVASKRRRPRPSRKLPTTYITADDPASFRRMVHQVTGADDNLPAADAPPPPPAAAPLETLCCRPAPYRTPGAVILPTLDTSAFLIGAPAPGLDRRMEAAAGGGGGGGACNNYSSNSNSNSGSSCGGGGGGFPTLDSWDDALF